MYYTSFNPWREINQVRRQMNRLFDNSSWRNQNEFPAVNLWTNADEAMVTAELPGYDQKDVDISLIGNILRLHGSRKAPECKDDEYFHRQERNYGVFNREVQLPFEVNANNIDAVFHNGILSIRLLRSEESKPKKIEIKTN